MDFEAVKGMLIHIKEQQEQGIIELFKYFGAKEGVSIHTHILMLNTTFFPDCTRTMYPNLPSQIQFSDVLPDNIPGIFMKKTLDITDFKLGF